MVPQAAQKSLCQWWFPTCWSKAGQRPKRGPKIGKDHTICDLSYPTPELRDPVKEHHGFPPLFTFVWSGWLRLSWQGDPLGCPAQGVPREVQLREGTTLASLAGALDDFSWDGTQAQASPLVALNRRSHVQHSQKPSIERCCYDNYEDSMQLGTARVLLIRPTSWL